MSKSRLDGARRAGFTLIELLAVVVILSLLAWVLVVNLTAATGAVDIRLTQVTGTEIGGAIAELCNENGDFPASSFPADLGVPPNSINMGGECLYLALCSENAPTDFKYETHLTNTDDDQLAKRPAGFVQPTLFELKDQWDNPFAYFHHRDYGRIDVYVTIKPETGERLESSVQAVMNPQTGRYFRPKDYQLISAGPDGDFETLKDNVTIGFDAPKPDGGDK